MAIEKFASSSIRKSSDQNINILKGRLNFPRVSSVPWVALRSISIATCFQALQAAIAGFDQSDNSADPARLLTEEPNCDGPSHARKLVSFITNARGLIWWFVWRSNLDRPTISLSEYRGPVLSFMILQTLTSTPAVYLDGSVREDCN